MVWSWAYVGLNYIYITLSYTSHYAMGASRHGGICPPWKCSEVFCALVVTVKRSDLESRSGSFSSFDLCFEGDD